MIDLSIDATQKALGDLVGVSQQAIGAMVSDGKISLECSLGEALQAYCQRLRDQAAGRVGAEVGGLDLVQERAALAREQRLGIEIKNATLRREYSPVALLAEVLATASQSVVERLDHLPGLLKKSCPDLPDVAREQVMTTIASARNEWVRSTEKLVAQQLVDMEEADDGEDDV